MKIRTTIELWGDAKQKLRELAPAMKAGLQLLLRYWFRNILPGHFERPAYAKYHYQKRTAFHEKRKGMFFHHRRPLEFSGEMKRGALRREDISGSSNRARITLHGPAWLTTHEPTPRHPKKADEIRTITDEESERLSAILNKYMAARLNKLPVHRQRKVLNP